MIILVVDKLFLPGVIVSAEGVYNLPQINCRRQGSDEKAHAHGVIAQAMIKAVHRWTKGKIITSFQVTMLTTSCYIGAF